MNELIKRDILPSLLEHLARPEITLIVGPRQAGKTTLLREMERYAQQQGQETLTLNLDKQADAELAASQQTLVDRMKLSFGDKRGVLFIDEIQQKEDAGRFLKGIYDMDLPYKIVVTGSGSLELKEKVHESLAGRKRIFEVSPLSFFEFAEWKTEYRYTGRIQKLFSLEPTTLKSLSDEYLSFGGYPRVVLAATGKDKRMILDEIYESYLLKDLKYLLNIQKIDDLRTLLRLLADQTGQLLNISSLARDIGASSQTITNYLWYLEQTFIIRRITPYSRLVRHEIQKAPIAYFVDPGMRNNILGRAELPLPPQDHSFVFQNMIANILHASSRHAATEVHFWRTKTDAEVDFVFLRGTDVLPIEVKDSFLQKTTISRSYRSFVERYKPERGLIVNHSLKEDVQLDKTVVSFLPWWELSDNTSLTGQR